jgi:hypothetical protein
VRPVYQRAASLGDALARARALTARTLILDVEPLVAYWDSGQQALDLGLARILGEAGAVPGVQVVCFATNSLRRPSVPPSLAGLKVVYLAAAGKPLRTSAYRGFPRPGLVIGDQAVTDGILARRLGYAFVLYDAGAPGTPAGPRLMGAAGRLVRPLLFTHAHTR